MPRSITSKPAPSSIIDTRFLPMSWMSPLTVPITILPIGGTPVSASRGRRISMPPFMAFAASSTSGTKRMPSRKSMPTMRIPSTSASFSVFSAFQPRSRNMCVASSTSTLSPLYRSSCTCSVSSWSLRSRKLNSASASAIVEISMRDRGLATRAAAATRMLKSKVTPGLILRDGGVSASDSLLRQPLGLRDRGHGLRRCRRWLALACLALGARRAAELGAVAAGKVWRRLEAAGCGDIDNRHRGLQQQLPGATQPQLQVVALRHAIQVPLEEPLDLAARESGRGGNLIERQRLLDVLLHELRHLDQALVTHAALCSQGDVLPVAVVADALDDELLGDQLRDARPELRLHQVQHQVERCHATGARETIPVDAEELIAQMYAGELLA